MHENKKKYDILIGDFRNIISKNDKFDLVITSPPFKENDIEGDYWEFYDSFMSKSFEVARKAIAVIHSATKMNEIIKRYEPKRTLIWNKGIVAYAYRYNPIFIYQIGDYKVNKYIWADTYTAPPINHRGKVHVYQDPVEVYDWIIKMFSDCETVLDPFCGSGTSGVAALTNGRNYLGIEIDKKRASVAMERLRKNECENLELELL